MYVHWNFSQNRRVETQTQIDVLTRLKSMACKGMKTHQQTTHAKQGSYTILKKICKTGESHFHYHQATNLLYNYQQIQSQPIRAHTCNYHKSAYQSPWIVYCSHRFVGSYICHMIQWKCYYALLFFRTKSTSWFLTKLHSYLRWQIDFERDSAITMKMYVHTPC